MDQLSIMVKVELFRNFQRERRQALKHITIGELMEYPLMDDYIPRADSQEKVYYREALKELHGTTNNT